MADGQKGEAEYHFKFREDEEMEYFTELALHEIERWIQAVTKKSLQHPDDTRKSLENGVLLCELLNCLQPGSVSRINRLPTPIAGLDNINVFLQACKTKFGLSDVHLFNPSDLEDLSQRAIAESAHLKQEYEKRLRNVAITVYWLGRYSNRYYQGAQLDLSAFSALIHHRQDPDIEQGIHPDHTYTSRAALNSSGDWSHGSRNSAPGLHVTTESPNESLEDTVSDVCSNMSSSCYSSALAVKSHDHPQNSLEQSHSTYSSNPDLTNRDASHRRYSSTDSVEGSYCSGHSRHGSDNQEVIYPTRRLNTQLSRKQSSSSDPLQFIKGKGAQNLAHTAEVQMRVASESKKGSILTQDSEESADWQAELSSWKSRRKSQSERSYQAKDQLEQADREGEGEVSSAAARTKTFSKMQEERQNRMSSRQKFYPIQDDTDSAHAATVARQSQDSLSMTSKLKNQPDSNSNVGPHDSDNEKVAERKTNLNNCKPDPDSQSDTNNNYSSVLKSNVNNDTRTSLSSLLHVNDDTWTPVSSSHVSDDTWTPVSASHVSDNTRTPVSTSHISDYTRTPVSTSQVNDDTWTPVSTSHVSDDTWTPASASHVSHTVTTFENDTNDNVSRTRKDVCENEMKVWKTEEGSSSLFGRFPGRNEAEAVEDCMHLTSHCKNEALFFNTLNDPASRRPEVVYQEKEILSEQKSYPEQAVMPIKFSRNIGSRTQMKIGSILQNFEDSAAKKCLPKPGYNEKIDLSARRSTFENVLESDYKNGLSYDSGDSEDDTIHDIQFGTSSESSSVILPSSIVTTKATLPPTTLQTTAYSSQDCSSTKDIDQSYVRRTVKISQKPNSEKGFGFVLSGGTGKQSALYIGKIILGSAADVCDLKVGDVVMLVNQTDVSAMTAAQVGDIVASSVGAGHIEMQVLREQAEDDFEDFITSSDDEEETSVKSTSLRAFQKKEVKLLQTQDTVDNVELEFDDRARGHQVHEGHKEKPDFEPPAILRKWQQQQHQKSDIKSDNSDVYGTTNLKTLLLQQNSDREMKVTQADLAVPWTSHEAETIRQNEQQVEMKMKDNARLLEERRAERRARIQQSASLASSPTHSLLPKTFEVNQELCAPLSSIVIAISNSNDQFRPTSGLQAANFVSDASNRQELNLTVIPAEFQFKQKYHTSSDIDFSALIEEERKHILNEELIKLREERQRAEEQLKNREREDKRRLQNKEEELQKQKELLRLEQEKFFQEKEEFKIFKEQQQLLLQQHQQQQLLLPQEIPNELICQNRTLDNLGQQYPNNNSEPNSFQPISEVHSETATFSSVLYNQQPISEQPKHPGIFQPIPVRPSTRLESTHTQKTNRTSELFSHQNPKYQSDLSRFSSSSAASRSSTANAILTATRSNMQTATRSDIQTATRGSIQTDISGEIQTDISDDIQTTIKGNIQTGTVGDFPTATTGDIHSNRNGIRFSREEILAMNRTAKPLHMLSTGSRDNIEKTQQSNVPIIREAPSREEIHSLNSVPMARFRSDADWQSSESCNSPISPKSVSPQQPKKDTYKSPLFIGSEDKGNSKLSLIGSGDHWMVQEAERRRIAESEGRFQSNKPAGYRQTNFGPIKPAGDSPNRWRDHTEFNNDRLKGTGKINPAASKPAVIRQKPVQITADAHGPSIRTSHSPSHSPPFPYHDNSHNHSLSSQVPKQQHHQQQWQYSPHLESSHHSYINPPPRNAVPAPQGQHTMPVTGSQLCSHCDQELGYGAAMVIESLGLFFHVQCFRCWVCHASLGAGDHGADVRVRINKLHCPNCYSNDEAGLKFSKV